MKEVKKEEVLKWFKYYSKAPHSPGVYWFIDRDDRVLYVGKAKDLKNRLSSYSQLKQIHGKTLKMVMSAVKLKFEVLENELTALLTEAELIKLYQPQFNIALKDDKTPLYIYVTSELYPQVRTVRKKDIHRLTAREGILQRNIFGPYQSAYRAKEILKLVRPIFKWCDKPMTAPQWDELQRQQIGQEVFVDMVGDQEKLFEDETHLSVGLKKIKPVRKGEYLSKVKPCFYYHIGRCSGACIGKVTPQEYKESIERLRKFLKGKTHQVLQEFKEEMKEAAHNEEYERAAEYRDAIRLIENFLKPTFTLKPDLYLPKLHETTTRDGLLFLRNELRKCFSLSKDYPLLRIEGFDVSNIQGKNAAVSMVVFTDGVPDKKEYRLFNIRSMDTPNDYQMMKEAVTRRQNHPEWGMPSLILIDGGRGQLRSALSVWEWEVPVVSLVKNPDRLVIPIFENPNEPLLANLKYHFVHFPEDHPTLRLLQQIRDESHRFAKKQHTRLRNRFHEDV